MKEKMKRAKQSQEKLSRRKHLRKLLSNRIEDWFCVRPCAVKKGLGNVSMNGMREGIENEQINFRTTQQEDLLFG